MKTSFLIIFAIFYGSVYSQARVNKENIKFENNLGELKVATGWSFNSGTGDWVDFPNLINNDASWKQFSEGNFDSLKAYREQNFEKMEFKTVKYNNSTFYILLVTKIDGYYEYPTIREGWKHYKKKQAFILTPSDYNKLVNLKDNLVLELKSEVSERIDYDYKEESLLDHIQYKLDNPNSYSSDMSFPLKISEEGMVRFFIPQRFTKYKTFDFEKEYFEISKEDYNKLLGL